MGLAGRFSHPPLVSRKRAQRKRPAAGKSARRAHPVPHAYTWPRHPSAASALIPSPEAFEAAVVDAAMPQDALQAGGLSPSEAAMTAEARAERARADSVLDMPLPTLSYAEPLQWLRAGWRDFLAAPWLGLMYGSFFVTMSWVLLGIFEFAPAYTLAMSAGFLLLGPFLCLGLYQASRSLEAGRQPRLWSSLTAWRVAKAPLAIFAGVLLVLEMLWGRSAMIVFAISFDGMPDFGAPLSVLLSEEYLVFYASYGAVCLIFGGLIFAISVISIPMIMDRGIDAISAGLASLRLFSTQMGVMLWWAAIVVALVLLALLPGFLGLLVVGPVLGHASWHAYRAATRLASPADAANAVAQPG